MTPNFNELLVKTKLRMLQMHFESNSGHLGGNLSCIDMLMTLYHHTMQAADRFILSKGHSAGALYATLWSLEKLTDADLKTFSKDNSLLPGHPSGAGIPGLQFSTGSLGHGPSLAAGLAIAAKRRHQDHQIYCLCSDGEWQEGSCWEALIFAAHQRLDNLTIMIDQNGLQGFGATEDIVSYSDLRSRISAFGVHVLGADGHDCDAIARALDSKAMDKPRVIILDTVKGRGLSLEGKMESHYLPLSHEQYIDACARIGGGRLQ